MRGRSTTRAGTSAPLSVPTLISIGSASRVIAAFIAYDELRVSHLPVTLLALVVCALASAILAAIELPWRNADCRPTPSAVSGHSPEKRVGTQRLHSPSTPRSEDGRDFLAAFIREPHTLNSLRGGAVVAVVTLLFLSGLKAAGPARAMLSDGAKLLVVAGMASSPLAAAAAAAAGLAAHSPRPSSSSVGTPQGLSVSTPSALGQKRISRGLVMILIACLLIAYDGSGTAPKPQIKKAVLATTRDTFLRVRQFRPRIPFHPKDIKSDPSVVANEIRSLEMHNTTFRRKLTLTNLEPDVHHQADGSQLKEPSLLSSRVAAGLERGMSREGEIESDAGETSRSSFNFDSELGVLLILLSAIVEEVSKLHVGNEVGGEARNRKIHNANSMMMATLMLTPAGGLTLFRWRPVDDFRLSYFAIRSVLCAFMFFVIPFYVDLQASYSSRSSRLTHQRYGYLATVGFTLVMSLVLKYEFSFFLVLSILAGVYAQNQVCLSSKGHHVRRTASEGLVGVSDVELENLAGSAQTFSEFLRAAVHDQESRQLLNFLIFQAAMVIVESIYGVLTDSIGLISASADTILCCVALFIGLRTTDLTRNRPNATYTFGYHRLESLSGFVNGILLIFVAFLIIFESVDRVIEPQDIENTRVVVISLVSSVCNGLGLLVFPPKGRRENHNLEGAYLHIWANTLATTGLLVSALMSESLGWQSSGNFVAVGVAVVIVSSAMPLLKRSASLLLLHLPQGSSTSFTQRISAIEGVEALQSLKVWELTPSNIVASVRVLVGETTDEVLSRQRVIAAIEEEYRISMCNVQISSGAIRPLLQRSQVAPGNPAVPSQSILL